MDSQFQIAFLMVTVILSCCINVISLELMVKEFSSCHHLITLSQFLFITICTFSLSRLKPRVPLREYFSLVVLYFLVTLTGNYSLAFNISMPLHMIFKSGSLIANMALSIIVFRRNYNLSKYLSVLTITLGIILCTLASSKNITSHAKTSEKLNKSTNDDAYLTWITGICLLIFSVVGAAGTGIFQEKISKKYGQNADEMMFFCHSLLLPSFIFLMPNISNTITYFNQSSPIDFINFQTYQLSLPKMWVFLFINIISTYCCSRSVFLLTGLCTSLTITLLITLRKFFSLILSIYIFKNVFTIQHWLGTVLVFTGTLIFADINPFSFIRFSFIKSSAGEQQISNKDKKS